MSYSRLGSLAISETGFIFDPITGNTFTTNEIGSLIINFLKEGYSDEEILEKIYSEYDVNKEDLESDIDDFKKQLKTYYLTN